MSNFLAIATVTAGLARILGAASAAGVPGSDASIEHPEKRQLTAGTAGVNIFLYQVTPNGALRDADLPTRDQNGQPVRRPQAALDLHYLLSFYGSEADLEPQRILGSVVRKLHAEPILSPAIIEAVVAAAKATTSPKYPFLATADLAEQVELVRFTPLALSLEEMSKLWSVYFQTPYALCVAYQASVVLIEQDITPVVAPPVVKRDVEVRTHARPVIEEVIASTSPDDPISATSTILIRGRGLRSDDTLVRLAGSDRSPGAVRDDQITFDLSAVATADLAAGPQTVQAIKQFGLAIPPSPHVGPVSNQATFLLSPVVTSTTVTGTAASGSVTVSTDLTIGKDQTVALCLLDQATGTLVRTLLPTARSADAPSVQVPVSGLAPGTYLAQLMVDGAGSVLLESGGVFTGPLVTLG